MKRTPVIFVMLACSTTIAVARGEEYSVIGGQSSPVFIQDHSSTAAEGYLRGAADLERANGSWLLNASQAAVNFEEAQRRCIENRTLRVRTYFELREYNRRRVAERHEVIHRQPPAPEINRPAQSLGVPIGRDGKIQWPAALQDPAYAADCLQLEAVFAKQANGKAQTWADMQLLRQIRKTMLAEVKQRIRELEPQEYTDTVRFVKSLTSESAADLARPQVADR